MPRQHVELLRLKADRRGDPRSEGPSRSAGQATLGDPDAADRRQEPLAACFRVVSGVREHRKRPKHFRYANPEKEIIDI